MLAPLRDQLAARRRAKADRIGHAVARRPRRLRGRCRAARRGCRRARGSIPLWLRNRRAGADRRAAAARSSGRNARPIRQRRRAQALDQEHVILVEMRADTAAVGGIAHHHIVDPPVRHEAERLEQRGDLRHILVDGLDEQGPALLAELGRNAPSAKGPCSSSQSVALFRRPGAIRPLPRRPGRQARRARADCSTLARRFRISSGFFCQ